jgi:uncharacterized membrane protein YgcG
MSIVINAIVAAAIFGEPFTVYPPHMYASNREGKDDDGTALERAGNCRCGECLQGWDLGAVLVLVVGTVIVGLNAPIQPETVYTSDEVRDMLVQTPFLLFLGLCAGIFALCTSVLCVSTPNNQHQADQGDEPQQNASDSDSTLQEVQGSSDTPSKLLKPTTTEREKAVLTAVLAATLGSLGVSFSKIVVLLIKTSSVGHSNQFTPPAEHWLTYAFVMCWIGLAVSGLTMLNRGLGLYDALLIIPVYYVSISMLTIVAGLLLYGTYEEFTPISLVCFILGLTLSLLGVLLLAGGRAVEHALDDELEDELGKHFGGYVESEEGSAQLRTRVNSVSFQTEAAGAGAGGPESDADPSAPVALAVTTVPSLKRGVTAPTGSQRPSRARPRSSSSFGGGGSLHGGRRSSQAGRRGSLLLSQNGFHGLFHFVGESDREEIATSHRRAMSSPGPSRRSSMPTPTPMGGPAVGGDAAARRARSRAQSTW